MTLQHIPFATLADLAENRIPTQEQTETLAHLSLCSQCDSQLTQLRLMIEMMRTHKVVDVPQHLDKFALQLFRPRIATSPSLLRRVQAALSFDSLQMSPAFGLRAAQSTTRQLIFSTDEYDLDLCIAPSGGSFLLTGQVLGPARNGTVELRGHFVTLQTDLNDSLEFSLPAAPAGKYELILRLRDSEIVVPNLQL
ncbi:MAG: hypothetical protein ACREEM_21330 [Blastocatellia bacterium]